MASYISIAEDIRYLLTSKVAYGVVVGMLISRYQACTMRKGAVGCYKGFVLCVVVYNDFCLKKFNIFVREHKLFWPSFLKNYL